DHLISGGAQRQLCTLAAFLQRRGHEVTVLTYHSNEFFLPLLREAGVGYRCVSARTKAGRIWALRRGLRGGNQDVVLAYLDGPCLYAELAALPWRRWGLVVSERSAVPGSHRARLPWRRWLHRTADYVVTNSHTNRLMLEHAVPALQGRVVTIYNAVDLDTFSPGPALGESLPAKPLAPTSGERGWGEAAECLPDKNPLTPDPSPPSTGERGAYRTDSERPARAVKLAVAALHDRHKNALGLIEAVALARSRAPEFDISVDWHGYEPRKRRESHEPSPLQDARDLIRRRDLEGCFRLHPDTGDVPGLFRQADAVALPSFYEGLPNSICEAMSFALPGLA